MAWMYNFDKRELEYAPDDPKPGMIYKTERQIAAFRSFVKIVSEIPDLEKKEKNFLVAIQQVCHFSFETEIILDFLRIIQEYIPLEPTSKFWKKIQFGFRGEIMERPSKLLTLEKVIDEISQFS